MCELRKLCAVWAAFSAPEIEAVGVLSSGLTPICVLTNWMCSSRHVRTYWYT